MLPLSAPHRLSVGCKVRWFINASMVQLGRQCGPNSARRVWTGNWVPVIVVAQTEYPHPCQTTLEGKQSPSPNFPATEPNFPGARKICKTGWEGLTNWGLFLFFSFFCKSKTIRTGVEKKTRDSSRKKSEGDYQQLRQISPCFS